MAITPARRYAIHPVHAVLLASALPLFLGALLSDWAYGSTMVIQYANFAAWLLAGALVFAGAALVWAIIDILRADLRRDRRRSLYTGVLAATFLIGFIDALVHAKDAWAMMPEGLVLSFITVVLALAAVWLGFGGFGRFDGFGKGDVR